MKIELDNPQATLSLERKIKMHEAREGIITRLARDLPTNIELERFLNVVVSEIGRMLEADRCDLLQLVDDKELRISHEWRRDDNVPTSLGTVIPIDRKRLSEQFDVTKPIRINDTSKSGRDASVFRQGARHAFTASHPNYFERRCYRSAGLHDTKQPREWLDEEITVLASAQQLAIVTGTRAVRCAVAGIAAAQRFCSRSQHHSLARGFQ